MVVEHLHDDRETSRACALVCQAWLPVTRHHLFGSITVDGSSVSRFARLVEDTPSLREYVRDFTTLGPGFFDGCQITRILLPLRNLESLSLTLSALHGPRDTQSPDDLLSAIWSLEHLRKLHLSGCHHRSSPTVLDAPLDVTGLALLESLSVLSLKHDVKHRLWRAIALAKQSTRIGDVRPLTWLWASLEDDRNNYAESLSEFNSFLQVVGHGLQYLALLIDTQQTSFLELFRECGFHYPLLKTHIYPYPPTGALPMPLCVNLQHLQLHFVVRADINPSLDAVCVLMPRIPHTAPLNQITINFVTSVVYNQPLPLADIQSLHALDRLLCSLPHLQVLNLCSMFTGRDSTRAKVEVEWFAGYLHGLKSKEGVAVNMII